MRKGMLLIMIFCLFIIYGCNNQAKADISTYPKVVQDSKVSMEFYDDFMEVYDKIKDVSTIHDVLYKKELDDPYILSDDDYINEVAEAIVNVKNNLSEDTGIVASSEIEEELLDKLHIANVSQIVYSKKLNEKMMEAKTDDEAMMFIVRSIAESSTEKLNDKVYKYELE